MLLSGRSSIVVDNDRRCSQQEAAVLQSAVDVAPNEKRQCYSRRPAVLPVGDQDAARAIATML
jgi:hypothetical protein